MSAPAAAVSPDGKRTAFAWMDKRRDGKDADVFWALTDGMSVASDASVIPQPEGDQDHPQIALSQDGKTAYVVWEDRRPGEPRIYGTSSALKGKALPISPGGGAQPNIACGKDLVAVVWEAPGDRIEFARFPEGK